MFENVGDGASTTKRPDDTDESASKAQGEVVTDCCVVVAGYSPEVLLVSVGDGVVVVVAS